jgi:hypothetical protein
MTHSTNTHPRSAIGRGWRSHSIDDRWDMYRYVVAALWAIGFILFTPSALQPVLTPVTTWIPMIVVVVGSGIAIVGRYRNSHLRIELWGALAIVLGMGFYLVLNVVLIVFASPERITQTLLTLLAMSFAAERLRVLLPRLIEALRSAR